MSEDGDRVRTWQKDTFHKKLFGGFKESHDIETGFIRAQKPWAKRLKKVCVVSLMDHLVLLFANGPYFDTANQILDKALTVGQPQ